MSVAATRMMARAALQAALPEEFANVGREPLEPRYLYIPTGHAKALDLNVPVVVGGRGVGKTVWWQALQDEAARVRIAEALSLPVQPGAVVVTAGFGDAVEEDGDSLSRWPNRSVLRGLLEEGVPAYDIWRAVIIAQVAGLPAELTSWRARATWVRGNQEHASRLLAEADALLAAEGGRHLVLFDALDRTSERREDRLRLLRALLSLAQELRGFRAVRIKAFVRPDMLNETILAFPDASKLLQNRVNLRWSQADLYGLLWQRLANTPPHDEWFRDMAVQRSPPSFLTRWVRDDRRVWVVPQGMKSPDVQRQIFEEFTGPRMGRDHRRGVPYVWLTSHLADGLGDVSPRSFLAALAQATSDTEERYPTWPTALHYESIKRGVAEASRIRVAEIKDDHPWVDMLLTPLEGLKVPCPAAEIVARWESHSALQRLSGRAISSLPRDELFLPPPHLEQGPEGVIEDLYDIGVFTRPEPGADPASVRQNIPDVYRVAYGILRKGGVRPSQQIDD